MPKMDSACRLPLPSMRIAIHTGLVASSPAQSRWALLSEVIIQLANSQPLHQFLAIGTQSIGNQTSSPNLDYKEVGYQNKLGPATSWWHRRQAGKAALRWKADLILNLDTGWQPAAGTPHVLLLHPDWQPLTRDFTGEKKPSTSKLALLKQTSALAVGYAWQAEKLASITGIVLTRMQDLGAATMPGFRPLAWAEKEAVKNSFSAGNEYFLYYGPVAKNHDILILLKAFSQFKKRQRCSMRLLLALTGPEGNETLQKKLTSYKYREEVQLLQELSLADVARLATGAYGIIASAAYQPGWWLLGGMQAGSALVAQITATSKEVCGPACYHLQQWETDPIAQSMMLLYKDETYRSKLIANGEQQIAAQGMNSVVTALWQCIENVQAGK